MFLRYLISQHYRSKTIVQHQRYYVYSVEKLAKREGNQPNESLSFFLPTKHHPRNNHVPNDWTLAAQFFSQIKRFS